VAAAAFVNRHRLSQTGEPSVVNQVTFTVNGAVILGSEKVGHSLSVVEQLNSRLKQIQTGSSLVVGPSCDYHELISFFYGVESGFVFTEEAKISTTVYADTVMKQQSNSGWTNIVMTNLCGWVKTPPQGKHELVYNTLFDVFFDYLRVNTESRTEREFKDHPTFSDLKEWSTVAIPRTSYSGRRYLICLEGLKVGFAPTMAESSTFQGWIKYLEVGPFSKEIETLIFNECMHQLERHQVIG
jgi:hypothetical protein